MNSTLGSVVPLAMFLDFPQNFRLSTWNQYCTQAIAWSTILDGGNTILDGGSTILDGSSTIFCRFSPFFVDFHHFLSIFTIYALLSRFTFCRDLRTFSANFFGQNSHLRHKSPFFHVCLRGWVIPKYQSGQMPPFRDTLYEFLFGTEKSTKCCLWRWRWGRGRRWRWRWGRGRRAGRRCRILPSHKVVLSHELLKGHGWMSY